MSAHAASRAATSFDSRINVPSYHHFIEYTFFCIKGIRFPFSYQVLFDFLLFFAMGKFPLIKSLWTHTQIKTTERWDNKPRLKKGKNSKWTAPEKIDIQRYSALIVIQSLEEWVKSPLKILLSCKLIDSAPASISLPSLTLLHFLSAIRCDGIHSKKRCGSCKTLLKFSENDILENLLS